MKELIERQNLEPLELFKDENINKIVSLVRDEASKLATNDVSTEKSRKKINSLARKIGSSKTFVDDIGKKLVSGWKNRAKEVDVQRRKVREQLDTLKEEIRMPLTEWEQAEQGRIEALQAKVAHLESIVDLGLNNTVERYERAIQELKAVVIDESWGEFKDSSIEFRKTYLEAFTTRLSDAKQREKEAAELEALRERERQRQQEEREKQIAKEAAERATREAEAKALEEKKREEALRVEEDRKKQAIQKNTERRRVVNNFLLEVMVNAFGLNEDSSRNFLTAVAKGQIECLEIDYSKWRGE